MTDQSKLCPICGYSLHEPAYDADGGASFDICPCCGTQFGYDDSTKTHEQLRSEWVQSGMQWWSNATDAPERWDPSAQLLAVTDE